MYYVSQKNKLQQDIKLKEEILKYVSVNYKCSKIITKGNESKALDLLPTGLQ